MHAHALFFDIDGTLVDSNESHVLAWYEAFSIHARAVSMSAIRKQIGKGADKLIPALLPDSNAALRHAIDYEHGQIFKSRYLRQVEAFPHATQLIRSVHRRAIRVVLASSAKPEELAHYVQLLGIGSLLDGEVSSKDVAESKPAGDIFAVALSKVAPIAAPETLAVGDTPYDIESAGRNGIETIAVRSGAFSDVELKDAGALAIYDNVAAILDDLDEVLRLRS